ncbi:hypothetical protein FIBSPDRAFT_860748 [Athelia psychrophila]|uniref:MYND-type domain-containing protein n=1 Tax=Athelia psychrophila TaxID=1759441 RepID=A0A166JWU2_9AGAM|nr:hypothetical protein FIBSPDRAFT_860748 [Fibularhizoctonia sp. CBS 109695]
MNRGIAAAFPTGIPGGSIGDVLYTFQSDLAEWTQLEERYRKGDGVCSIICGDPQCMLLNFKDKLRRCAGCSFVCYCSTTCQQRHWRSDHRKLCQIMRNSAKARVGLSGPNLRFLAYAIAHDATHSDHLQNKSVLRDSSGSPLSQPGRKLVLVLDYDGGQERPTPRVEINVVDLQSPADIETKFSSRIPELQDVWQQCWGIRMQPDGTPMSSRYILLPVLALIPRGWRQWDDPAGLAEQDSQSVAALLVWQAPEKVPTSIFRRLRWLHCA